MSLGRLTLGAARTRIAEVLNVCSTDTRIAAYLNEAQEILLPLGKWAGTVARYRICASDALITWPREIETIEAYAVCRTPGTIHNGWWEFLGNGIGIAQDDEYMGNTLLDRDEVCCFADPEGDNQKLRLYADNATDAGKRVLLQFYDENNNRVRTLDAGSYYDGEWVTLVAPPAYALSTHYVKEGSLYGVQKPVTNGTVRLYCYDTVALTQFPLGYYEHDETLPTYRRSAVPYLMSYGDCDSSDCDDDEQQITVRAKLRHIPVSADNDWLIIDNLPALALMVQAVKNFKPGGDLDLGLKQQALAVQMLEKELGSHQGAGAVTMPRFQTNAAFGAGGIGLNARGSGCTQKNCSNC